MLLQRGDEFRRARYRVLLVHQHAVHVSEPRFDGLGIAHGGYSSSRSSSAHLVGLSLSVPALAQSRARLLTDFGV